MIELVDVCKTYPSPPNGEIVALQDVSLSIPKGAIHGIVGQSGAGKSTLIRCLTALERPTSGSIVVDGLDMATLSDGALRAARRNIGMVFQQPNLLDNRTAGANVAYPLQIARARKEIIAPRVDELLDTVGLSGRSSAFPSQLSGGQRQRVGIARAMADNPAVLLCDEPTSALDSGSTVQILDLLRDLRDKSGVTVVIITHEMRVVTEVCDSVTLLQAGQVIQDGPLDHVISDVESPLSEALVPPPSVDDADIMPGTTLIDVSFTSKPGVPTGATVLNLIASLGADVTAGRFESVGTLQVGRLAISVPDYHVDSILTELHRNQVHAERRPQ
jgi:ABC-type metal ion transport system, ATPase component